MKKLTYQKAAMEVVLLQQSGQLLQGSGGMKKLDPFNNGGDPLNGLNQLDSFEPFNPMGTFDPMKF